MSWSYYIKQGGDKMRFDKLAVDEQYVMWATTEMEKEEKMVKTGTKEKKLFGIFKYTVPIYEKQIEKNYKINLKFSDGSQMSFGFGNKPEDMKQADEIFERCKDKIRMIKV